MALLKIKLSRNLRRTVLRGHPWIYRDSIHGFTQLQNTITQAQLCLVQDMRGEDLAWAMYDPHSPLALRILSLEKTPPQWGYFAQRLSQAFELRKSLDRNLTTGYRLINGEGDLLPGLICDIYKNVAILQFDGQGPREFWEASKIANYILQEMGLKTVFEKPRRHSEAGLILLAGAESERTIEILENGVRFLVDVERGQKTGFFLDQRDNREYIRTQSKDKTVLNLFSYTGGFSIYAGLGGAKQVASLDIAEGAIESAKQNWLLNGLDPSRHEGLCVDVFKYLTADGPKWDHIIVDPPSMGHSEEQKERANAKYIELFATAAKRVRSRGELSLSSCSSHVSFEMFFEIIEESLSAARRKGQILRVSGQGFDHPFPHSSLEQRYLKFVHLVLD